MRLDVDLGYDCVPGRTLAEGPAQTIELHAIAAALRSRDRLRAVLRTSRFDEVLVREGELPLSAIQALALLSLSAVRTPRLVVDGRPLGRPLFFLRALAKAIIAVPSELLRTVSLAAHVRRFARRRYHLPTHRQHPESVLYLRVDPSLKWLGVQVGGAATHTSGVINGLVDNGLAVSVLAPEQPQDTERAQFLEVPVRRMLHLVRGLAYTDYTDALLLGARGRSADFVYQRYQLGSYAGLELARRLRVPLVLEFNGSEIWVERHWGSGHLRLGGTLERLERRNLIDASLVVVVSEPLRDYAVEQGVAPERVLVNPNGVDVARLAPYRQRSAAEWRNRLGLPDAPTVGFIGTFGLWHGVKLLPALVAAVPEAQWVLIGDGGLFAEVREEIDALGLAERVRMTGVLEHTQALEMLSCSDVCISPHVPNPDGTPFFGSPTKLFEYMGLRRAIVASDLDQIGEVIENERSGLLCPPGDVEAAAAAVRRLLEDAPLRERLAEGAFERASERYSWSAHTRRILAALSGDGPRPIASLTAVNAIGDAAKQAAQRQWTSDPCGPQVDATPGTSASIEQLLVGRRAYAPWLAQALDYPTSAGLDVLDVGCGQGIDVVEYARAGARVTGVDLTPRHVELARSHTGALGLDATILAGDAEHLPFPDASFDRVSSNGVLHHTPDMPAALREVLRVLRGGGEARIIVYNRRSFHYWLFQVLWQGIRHRQLLQERSMAGVLARGVERSSIEARPLVRVYSPPQLRRLMRQAGFSEVRTSVGVFNTIDTPISDMLARHTGLLDSPRVRERIGRIGGWYVMTQGRRSP